FAAGFTLARRILRHSRQQAALEALGMSCSNSAYLGLPVATLLVGDVALQVFAMAMLVEIVLILHPLAVFAALYMIGPPPPVLLTSGVVFAAVPMLSIYALFGLRWGNESLAAMALIVATVVSFFTVSTLLGLLGHAA
ncbi:MAG: hypothetical protein Q8O82_15540, partial [Pseudorhodobacter sp.]|nr:hypothetical protein [Pseudorhodobacter sp.]